VKSLTRQNDVISHSALRSKLTGILGL